MWIVNGSPLASLSVKAGSSTQGQGLPEPSPGAVVGQMTAEGSAPILQEVKTLHNLFRHRSDTIGNSVVSETLGFMVGVAGFEPATPSSRTRSPRPKYLFDIGL
jgi:hypothetical protein